MDVNALLGTPTGSAARAVSQLVNTPPPAGTGSADGAAPASAVGLAGPQFVDAPSATPAVEEADLRSLPLAIKYAPSSPPGALRTTSVDHLA